MTSDVKEMSETIPLASLPSPIRSQTSDSDEFPLPARGRKPMALPSAFNEDPTRYGVYRSRAGNWSGDQLEMRIWEWTRGILFVSRVSCWKTQLTSSLGDTEWEKPVLKSVSDLRNRPCCNLRIMYYKPHM